MSSSTEPNGGAGRTGSQETYEMRVSKQDKYWLEFPSIHLSTAGFEIGDEIGIRPINYNGQFCLSLTNDGSGKVFQTLREGRRKRADAALTIPRRIAAAANLGGETLRYNSEEGAITAILDHEPKMSGALDVYNVEQTVMSQWDDGSYPYHLVDPVYEKVEPGEQVWFWYDVLGNDFVFVLEADEEKAPEYAVGISVQDSPTMKDADYFVWLPKKVCDAFELGGKSMKWGHDGERILGLLD